MNVPFPRLSAALADRYRLERELGVGGMATVYLAEDLKHDRKVAVKVLKPELAAVLGAARFVVEIKTTAALQHPHILPLFDSGEADGFLYYVMPFIDGETLRAKLDRDTQLGVDEAVKLTGEVADALHYAHEHGVIHRDIKPENILLANGRPMVADFGIALALSAAAGGRMTETGLSLGTPHYMSPEQATAEKEITRRSDIYSLASVLYEMLAGQPPHRGGSAQRIIMKIIAEPSEPVTRHRKSVPPHVAAALARALEKLPADRFATADAFAKALTDRSFVHSTASAADGVALSGGGRGGGASHKAVFAALGIATLSLGVAAWALANLQPPAVPSRQRVVLWQQTLPPLLEAGSPFAATQATIAPDGSSIVFVDSLGGQLLRKLRNAAEPTPLSGTEGALSPFVSPDGAWVGYTTADGRLRKVPIDGGGSVTLAEDANLTHHGVAWLEDQTILYIGRNRDLRRVPAAGGQSSDVLIAGTDRISLRALWPLPESRGLLFTSCPLSCAVASSIRAFVFGSDSSTLLVPEAYGAWFVPGGHLLYTSKAGGLFRVGFDPERLALTSGAEPVIEGVAPGSFTFSASGNALYTLGGESGGESELVRVTRDGSVKPVDPSWRGRFEYPAISPNGEALAVSLVAGTTDLWVRRSDGTRQRMTRDATLNWRPFWAPDGRSLIYSSTRGTSGGANASAIFRIPMDLSAPPELVVRRMAGIWEAELSRDTSWIVFRSDDRGNDSNIRARRLRGDTSVLDLAVSVADEAQIALSPDSRWMAYAATITGRREIYVTAFPDGSSTRLVSQGGGAEPRWSRDGRELFFKSAGNLVVVSVPPGPLFAPGVPVVLFPVKGFRAAENRQQYDVAPDGQSFVMIRELGANVPTSIIYVENWLDELRAKVKQ